MSTVANIPLLSRYMKPVQLKLLVSLILGAAGLNALAWFFAVRLFPADDPTAILHYSVEVGVDFIGEGTQITRLPLLGTIMLIFNTVMGWALLRANPRVSWLLWVVVPFIQISIVAALYSLWRINA